MGCVNGDTASAVINMRNCGTNPWSYVSPSLNPLLPFSLLLLCGYTFWVNSWDAAQGKNY